MAGFQTGTLDMCKKSIIFTVMCGCIPGYIFNVKKAMELKCWKAICYRDHVPAGTPKEACDDQDAYNWCVFVTGQFMFILDFLESPLKFIANFLLNPFATGWAALRMTTYWACLASLPVCVKGACTITYTGACGWYAGIQLLTTSAEVIQQLETAGDLSWETLEGQLNYCEQLIED